MSTKKRKQGDIDTGITLVGSVTPAKKLLSCQRCRSRKVKCNFEHPCSNCVKVGAECIQVTNDMRKKRPPANYVSTLEKKINLFSNFFEQYNRLTSTEQKRHFIDLFITDELTVLDLPQDILDHSVYDSGEDRAVYGPTSVYDDSIILKNSKLVKSEEATINILNKDPDILQCIKLFFIWQYPDHNMFIFRESFLTDFFNPKSQSLYCSEILVYSICALGSKMADSDAIYSRSSKFYNDAKSRLLAQLDHPSITSLQSFLLLAFYDICNGSNSSSWMLSGNAMRMGFDLGFQLNPKVWFLKSKDDLSELDVAIRSRIYWGSYMADHFISLLLGRPSLLKMSDATIPETDALPDLEWIDEYMYSGPNGKDNKDITYISNPLKKIINLINISENMLNDIFTKSDTENHQTTNEELDLSSRIEKLYEYNAQIMKWRNSLPEDLKWDKQILIATADNPRLSCIRYYYYILLICLNRPFVGILKDTADSHHDHELSPFVICSNAIDDLYEAIRKFNSVHGLRRASIFIVYCSILSISVLLLSNTSRMLVNEKREKLQFFMNVLQACSKTWKLAEKSYNLIKIKLRSKYENDQDELSKVATDHLPKDDVHSIIDPEQNTLQSRSHDLSQDLQSANIYKPDEVEINNLNSQTTATQQPNLPNYNSINNTANSINNAVAETNTELLFDENLDFFGGPPVLMTSDLFNEDWESFFPDYVFNQKN